MRPPPRLLLPLLLSLCAGFGGGSLAEESPPQPASVCATEMDEVDQAICRSDALAKLDLELSKLQVDVLTALPDTDKTPFLSAQNHWLTLRGEACQVPARNDNPPALERCLTALYGQRRKELLLQQRLLAPDYGPRLNPATVDAVLDTAVDEISPLTVYDRRGALPVERAIHSCRDAQTFAATGWQSPGNKLGQLRNSAVQAACAYALLTVTAHQPKQALPEDFDPSDLLNFAYGFGQLTELAAGQSIIADSLRSLVETKTLTLVAAEPEADVDAVCDTDAESEPLYRFPGGYSFNCGYFRIKQMSRGDFDGTGEETTLMLVYSHSGESGDRFFLVQGRYDPTHKALKPELRGWEWPE